MKLLPADYHSGNLITIDNYHDRSLIKSISVSKLVATQEVCATNFYMNTFDFSPKGEVFLKESITHIKPKVVLKALKRARHFVDMADCPSFTIGKNVICEICDNTTSPRIAAYTETNINDNKYYLTHRFAGKFHHKNFEHTHINLIFGICLFDNESVFLVSEDNQKHRFLDVGNPSLSKIKIDKILIDTDWTLYEIELITRLTRCIADAAVSLKEKTTVTVKYNIPRVEYYCYLLQSFESGNINISNLLQWFDAVDERYERVVQTSIKMIQKNLKFASIDIIPANTFGDLESFIRHNVTSGKIPSLQDAMRLMAEKYPLWNKILNHFKPQNFVDLTRLSYVYEYISAGKSVSRHDDTLCLAIEAYHEYPILDYAKLYIESAHANSVHVHAMYPMKQIALYTANDDGEMIPTGLYKNRPHPNMQDVHGNIIDIKLEFLKLFDCLQPNSIQHAK
ncbi:MAG: hypothetical protein PHN45_10820 [Methylococcales bacterium]|nr:hypothetical protein [Methylococcales bacterium]MDD5755229.1 hypothetical protein [Methylococcales bacterium]